MSLPATKAPGDFSFIHDDQVDDYGVSVGDFNVVQQEFDTRAVFNQTQINAILTALASVAADDSGAKAIGYEGSAPDATVAAAIDTIFSAGSGTIPPDNTITQAKMTDNSIGTAELIAGEVTEIKLGTIQTITLDTGDTLTYDTANNVLKLNVDGATSVQLAMIVFGTGASPPAGTFPQGTVYMQHEA
jgi:hypothetical protein